MTVEHDLMIEMDPDILKAFRDSKQVSSKS